MNSTQACKKFWNWFDENRHSYEKDRENAAEYIGVIKAELDKINDTLVCEASIQDSSIIELVISADGIKEVFPLVQELVALAPEMPGWKVTAFRPRMDISKFTLDFGEVNLNAPDVYFELQTEQQFIDITLFLHDLTDENRDILIHACFILLDMSIGEYDVSTKLRYIDHKALPTDPVSEGLKPLTDLPAEFDKTFDTLPTVTASENGKQKSFLEKIWPFSKKKLTKAKLNANEHQWTLLEGKNSAGVILIRLNQTAKKWEAHKDLSLKLGFAIPLNNPHEGGLPEPEENIQLGEIEEIICDEINTKTLGIQVLVITNGQMKEIVFYISPGPDIERIHESLQRQIKTHEVQCMAKMEPDWLSYRDFSSE